MVVWSSSASRAPPDALRPPPVSSSRTAATERIHALPSLPRSLIVCCSSGSPAPGVTVLPGATLPPGAAARFTAHIDHQARTLTFTRVPAAPALTTRRRLDQRPGTRRHGRPQPRGCRFVSPNGCMFPTGQFQCLVTMIWADRRGAYRTPSVQIDEDLLPTTRVETNLDDANNSDQSNPLAISIDHGLWVYNTRRSRHVEPGPERGSLLPHGQGGRLQHGLAHVVLRHPSGQDVTYDILVGRASRTPRTASITGSAAYVNVCSGGTSTTASTGSVVLPFDVTLYDQTYIAGQSLSFAKDGHITLGSVGLTAASEPPVGASALDERAGTLLLGLLGRPEVPDSPPRRGNRHLRPLGVPPAEPDSCGRVAGHGLRGRPRRRLWTGFSRPSSTRGRARSTPSTRP